MTAPLAVFDATSPDIDPYRAALCQWLRARDIDPDAVYRVEIYLAAPMLARVHAYDLDTDGRKQWAPRVEHGKAVDSVLTLPPFDILIEETR